ncbi:MAG: hypothetical protein AAGI66_04240 [Cyanobacteria bacterium P01_H01_bin.74]
MVEIYTLNGLSEKEGTSPNYLNVIIHRLRKKGLPLVWRGYKFMKAGGKTLLAVLEEEDVQVVDS